MGGGHRVRLLYKMPSIVYSQQLFSLGIFSVPSMPTLASPM